MTGMYTSEHFGAWQIGEDPNQGAIEFKLFFPNASQYENKGGKYGDPQTFRTRLANNCLDIKLTKKNRRDYYETL